MGLMMLFGVEGVFAMWLLLLGAVTLTATEAWQQKLDVKLSAWWVLFVLLTHVAGYVAMRIWVYLRNRSVT